MLDHFKEHTGKPWEDMLRMIFWDKCCQNATDKKKNIFVALFKNVRCPPSARACKGC